MTKSPNRGFRLTRFMVERLYGLRSILRPPLDAIDFLHRVARGKTRYPPLSARQLVSGRFWASVEDFERVGRAETQSLQETMGLAPGHSVLDIGCGCGRVARPLLELLGPSGHYFGGDVDLRAIQWCQKNIAPHHPNAKFFHIDAYKSIYNPHSKQLAKDYRFPVEDGSIDGIFLTSVFTHMLPEDVENYLREMARLLSKEGCVYAGVFLVSPERLEGQTKEAILTKFPYSRNGTYLASEKYPDLEVAYDEDVFVKLAERCGLAVKGPTLWGTWAGTSGYRPLDVVLLRHAS
jgi:SAM-dependent methyltransferase